MELLLRESMHLQIPQGIDKDAHDASFASIWAFMEWVEFSTTSRIRIEAALDAPSRDKISGASGKDVTLVLLR